MLSGYPSLRRQALAYLFRLSAITFTAALFFLPHSVKAASVTWDGVTYSSADPSGLDGITGQGLFPTDQPLGVQPSNHVPNNNTVTIKANPAGNNTFVGNVYGGIGLDAYDLTPISATGNKVILQDNISITAKAAPHPGANAGSIYGALSASADVSGNSVTLGNNYTGTVEGDIYGGSTGRYFDYVHIPGMPTDGNATGNAVTIMGGNIQGSVYGGETFYGNATGNSVSISGGTLHKPIWGGYAAHSGSASNNTVTVTGGTFSEASLASGITLDGGTIFGGASQNGTVSGNTVSVGGNAVVGASVYGGYTGSATATGDVSGNSATVAVNVGGAVIGGQTAGSGKVSGNSVTITSGAINGVSGIQQDNAGNLSGDPVTASAIGGFSKGTGDVTGNSVTMQGGSVGMDMFGGYAYQGAATGNSITISGGTTGAGASVVGGYAEMTGDASQNTVTLSGAGAQINGPVFGGSANNGRANGNTIAITNATVNGPIYGGQSATNSASGNTVTVQDAYIGTGITGGNSLSATAATINNTVSISGSTRFGAGADIIGGSNSAQGNTLNTKGIGYHVNSITNFENYTFGLSGNYGDKTAYAVNTAVDLADTKVHVTFTGEGAPLRTGEKFTLFSDTANNGQYSYEGKHGILFSHDAVFEKGPNDELNVRITGTSVIPESKIPGQSQLAGLQMVNAASDLIRDVHGLFDVAEIQQQKQADAASSDLTEDEPAPRIVAFAGTRSGSSRWKTGGDSKINLDHNSVIAGIGGRTGGFLLAGFVETGWGYYDIKQGGKQHTRNEDTSYIGGGALARWEKGGFYVEGSAHAGSAKVELDALLGGTTHANYSMKAAYIGADALIGYKWTFDSSALDISGRYAWNHLKGDDIRVGKQDVSLEGIDSHRFRGGARWTYGGEYVSPYIGAHYEYEGDGKAHASAYGYDLHRATLRGGSGIGELGIHIGDTLKGIGLDIGVEAYTGRRKGLTGKAMLGISF